MALSAEPEFAFHMSDVLLGWIRTLFLSKLAADVPPLSTGVFGKPRRRAGRSGVAVGSRCQYGGWSLDGPLGTALRAEDRPMRCCRDCTSLERHCSDSRSAD